MALYTCQNVIDAVKRIIEEAADANVVTSGQLIQFVSDSQIQVANESQCLQTSGSVALVVNTIAYNAPTDTESIIDVIYKYPWGYDSLRKIEPGFVPVAANAEYPYFYNYRANKIMIYPELEALPVATTVLVLYAKLPVAITALTDNLTIPDSYQAIIPYKVAMLVALKDNQLEKAAIFDNIIKSFYAGGITAISKYSSSMPAGNSTPAIG